MKDVIKAMCVILAIIGVVCGAVIVLSRTGLLKRRYLTVQES